MESIKEKIERIKLARMGEEYRFMSNIFSDLVPHKSKAKPHHIYFMKDDVPVISYDIRANYVWCHYELIWTPFQNIVTSNMMSGELSNTNIMKRMREVFSHFALAYFDISDATFSLAHSFITESWKTLKFRRAYVW